MPNAMLDETSRRFLQTLFEHTHGDATVQVSMYEIGETVGLDRDEASKVAQNLMGWALVEVRTLSGGIGITDEGVSEVKAEGPDESTAPGSGFVLESDGVLNFDGREAVSRLISLLKQSFNGLGLDFQQAEAYVADLKTIDAQLTSSAPKSAILRECFRSIKEPLQAVEATDELTQINAMLQE